MDTFKHLRRADYTRVENNHSIYRVYEIPGLRRSKYYEASGVEKTYNMAATDNKQYPDDEEAVPDLAEVTLSDGRKKQIIRKKVTRGTFTCPECDVPGRESNTGEKFCPECGMLLGQRRFKLDRSPDSAGRLEGGD